MTWNGPNAPIHIEQTWDTFVNQWGGRKVSDLLPKSPSFDNADYIFCEQGIVAELKELQTELTQSDGYQNKFENLMQRLITENPSWRPLLLGGDGLYPSWFSLEYVRLFRPPITRIIKKANRQLRETKEHFRIKSPTGILLFVNDGFTSLAPEFVMMIASDALVHSYRSIDCFVYITVNSYVDVPGSDLANLMWAPLYSDRASDDLVEFVNMLGRDWFNYLEKIIGPFDGRQEIESAEALRGSKVINSPSRQNG